MALQTKTKVMRKQYLQGAAEQLLTFLTLITWTHQMESEK